MFVTQPNAIIGHVSIDEVRVERDELAERDAAADHLAAAEPQHEQRAEAEEERHARVEEPLQPDQPPVALEVLVVRRAEALHLGRFLPVGAHDAHAGQRLLGDGAQVGELRLDPLEPPVDGRCRSSCTAIDTNGSGISATSVSRASIDSISADRDDEQDQRCWPST